MSYPVPVARGGGQERGATEEAKGLRELGRWSAGAPGESRPLAVGSPASLADRKPAVHRLVLPQRPRGPPA
eukprot:501064-Alexandrium_andersonii.AAC.1